MAPGGNSPIESSSSLDAKDGFLCDFFWFRFEDLEKITCYFFLFGWLLLE